MTPLEVWLGGDPEDFDLDRATAERLMRESLDAPDVLSAVLVWYDDEGPVTPEEIERMTAARSTGRGIGLH